MYAFFVASLVAQTVKSLRAMQETRVQSLGQEDLLEEEIATHSSNLAWKIPCTEKPGGLWSSGSQTVGHTDHALLIPNRSANEITDQLASYPQMHIHY